MYRHEGDGGICVARIEDLSRRLHQLLPHCVLTFTQGGGCLSNGRAVLDGFDSLRRRREIGVVGALCVHLDWGLRGNCDGLLIGFDMRGRRYGVRIDICAFDGVSRNLSKIARCFSRRRLVGSMRNPSIHHSGSSVVDVLFDDKTVGFVVLVSQSATKGFGKAKLTCVILLVLGGDDADGKIRLGKDGGTIQHISGFTDKEVG